MRLSHQRFPGAAGKVHRGDVFPVSQRNFILITGATGFVGRAVCASLSGRWAIRVSAPRIASLEPTPGVETIAKQLSAGEDWSDALAGVDVLVHCAARVHIMNDQTADFLAQIHRVNVEGTLRLAEQAAVAGVRRFVFLSSIKANGEQTEAGQAFSADEAPKPGDPYGISKWQAEERLRDLATRSGMELVVIRPPLVYGPGVKANFETMMRWIWRGIPLPFGAVTNNRRSLVALDNLVDLVKICIDHPAAANQTFLVSDGEDLSTADLLKRLGRAMGRPVRLIAVPAGLLKLGAWLLRRPDLALRLTASLEADIGKTRRVLGWTPPIDVDEGLRRAAAHWIQSRNLPSR